MTARHPAGSKLLGMATASTAPLTGLEDAALEDAARFWWLKLLTAACWLLLSVIVFRFDWTSVSSISILFGIVLFGAAVAELVGVFTTRGWWRLAYALLALAFGVLGVISFIHPGNTFRALAAVLSFYFIFKGSMTIAVSLGLGGFEFRWVTLLVGIAELLLGFWSAAYFGHRAILLVAWVGALALTRAITDVIEAFAIRSFRDTSR
jgi:uncharacterized membrane protein HdeD (DUF308 family)